MTEPSECEICGDDINPHICAQIGRANRDPALLCYGCYEDRNKHPVELIKEAIRIIKYGNAPPENAASKIVIALAILKRPCWKWLT